ncbi:metallophosphoesterase [Paenibacillaceae bacterium]|nr:metallophosphoesterase [Paenibacillaceae bacterium]
MKALIISDIHANICALEAVWKQEKDSDKIYCAGDLVDCGPYSKEVIAWMAAHQAVCVKGNHDQAVVAAYRGRGHLPAVAVDRSWLEWNAAQLSEIEIAFLEQLPEKQAFELDGIEYCMQHMYKGYSTIESRHQFEQFWLEQVEEKEHTEHACPRRLLFGHTHYQSVHWVGNHELWLNPGGCSYRANRQRGERFVPDEPSKDAHYMTIVDGYIEFKSVAYSRKKLMTAALDGGLGAEYIEQAYHFFN